MAETSLTLLDALKQNRDGRSWQQLVEIYSPLIQGWLRRHGAKQHDVDDLVQNVLTVVFRRLGDFDRERTGAFRSWLRMIAVNCLRDHWRAQRARPTATGDTEFVLMLNELADSDSQLSRVWNEEHDHHVTTFLLAQVRTEFRPATWKAFEQFALKERDPEAIAAELGISTNAVYIAKSRVLKRLREVGAGLVD
jgi:RNA polymerase sigma-70 factor (ECF subfamily)